jgi:hypothetical protein
VDTAREIEPALRYGLLRRLCPTIHPVIADPRCAFIHELEDLYVSKTA